MPHQFHNDYTIIKIIEHLRESPGCGLFQRLPELAAGHLARCSRCECRLERHNINSRNFTPMALSISSIILYLLAVTQPLMSFDIYSRFRTIGLLTGPLMLIHEGWQPVGVLVILATVICPAIVIGLTLIVTMSVARGQISTAIARQLRWYDRLRPWSMVEVYILGVFAAYSRHIDLARVETGFAIYALVGLMITMASTDATLRVDLIWRCKRIARTRASDRAETARAARMDASSPELPPTWKIVACSACGLVCSATHPLEREAPAGPCPRCGQMFRQRKPDSLRRTLTLLMAATILYIPANLFPIMTIVKFYRGGGHTIIGEVRELYDTGMLPLVLLVFFASITVPALKILSLIVMMLSTWRALKFGWWTARSYIGLSISLVVGR